MEKYGKLSIFIILIPTPDFPHFTIHDMLGGNLGSLLYGDVSVMQGGTSVVINYFGYFVSVSVLFSPSVYLDNIELSLNS